MKIEPIVHRVQNYPFLRLDQKERLLKILPRLSDNTLKELEMVLDEGERILRVQKQQFDHTLDRIGDFFCAMSCAGIKVAKKEAYKRMEKNDQIHAEINHSFRNR